MKEEPLIQNRATKPEPGKLRLVLVFSCIIVLCTFYFRINRKTRGEVIHLHHNSDLLPYLVRIGEHYSVIRNSFEKGRKAFRVGSQKIRNEIFLLGVISFIPIRT